MFGHGSHEGIERLDINIESSRLHPAALTLEREMGFVFVTDQCECEVDRILRSCLEFHGSGCRDDDFFTRLAVFVFESGSGPPG